MANRRKFAMAAPLPLRSDFDADMLRREARGSRDAAQARRLLALATICDGGSRGDAARVGGVTLQIVRDRVVRFDAQGPAGLIDRKAPGATPKRDAGQKRALAGIVEKGPIPRGPWRGALAADRPRPVGLGGVPRLGQPADAQPRAARAWLAQALRAPAPSRAGPRHARAGQENFPATLAVIAEGKGARAERIELWFQDEMRVGQKTPITRRRAKRGTRPAAPRDQRTQSASVFGAIGPAEGRGAAIVMPRCVTEAMTEHLAEISRHVVPGAHAVVLLDRAGWHQSRALVVPDNVTLVPLPAHAPEMNPVENIWQYMRDNWLSKRIFRSYDDILENCCAAWNRLVDQPWTIIFIGRRQWAHGF
jgi:transposase